MANAWRRDRAPNLLLSFRQAPQEHRPDAERQALSEARHLRHRPEPSGGEARQGVGGRRRGERGHGDVRRRGDGLPGGGVRARIRKPAEDLRGGVLQPGRGPGHGVRSGRVGSGREHHVPQAGGAAGQQRVVRKRRQAGVVQVRTVPLDEVVPDSQPVVLVKIDVQGWELHVLKGARRLLSRKPGDAPYVIYEEDERLLQASNTTAKEIRDYLRSVGYLHCTQHGTDAHCTKSAK